MFALNSIIAVYETQIEAEIGLHALQEAGFDLRKVSIIGREHESGEHVIGYYNMAGRMKYWGARGTFWNSLWKLLAGAAYFFVPGIGGVLIAGPLTVWLVAGLKEAVVDDLSPLGAGLSAISIPRASISHYESAVKTHRLLLIMYGTTQEILKSKDILRDSRPEEITVHFADEEVQTAA
jgi:hypothetical protein